MIPHAVVRSGKAGTGWQMLLTDLAMILFMVTVGAVTQANERSPHAAAPSAKALTEAIPPEETPLAIFRDEPGAPPFGAWLAAQPADPRQRLTIVARYRPGGSATALERAAALLRAAEATGAHPRIVIEPGSGSPTAGLAFDGAEEAVAQGLRGGFDPDPTHLKVQP